MSGCFGENSDPRISQRRLKYAEVAVDVPTVQGKTFTYHVPSPMEIQIGQIVLVPFGPRKVQGIVTSQSNSTDVQGVKSINAVGEKVAVLSSTHLDLAFWLSEYYMCTIFEAAKLMLPPGGRFRTKNILTPALTVDSQHELSLTAQQARMLDDIREKGEVDERSVYAVNGRLARQAVKELIEGGFVKRVQKWLSPKLKPAYREYLGLAVNCGDEIERILSKLSLQAYRQKAVLSWFNRNPSPIKMKEARKEFGSSAIRILIQKGVLKRISLPQDRDPLHGNSYVMAPPVKLNTDQKVASKAIQKALVSDTPNIFLLEGVTGSGKTEVYLDAVKVCLNLGKRAVILLPEISLTPQTIQRFSERFPGNVAILHSGLKLGERFDQWMKINNGLYGVVVGSRSAVFAPIDNLGLIIIDEEHEWSYKQHESSPRYHARSVALRLGALTGAVNVLGSASPDVHTYSRTRGSGIQLLKLPQRVRVRNELLYGKRGNVKPATNLARAEIVDMRDELRSGNRHIFSKLLQQALSQCLIDGSQAMLFLNRRGSVSYVQCRICGLGLCCRRCDIAMTYHQDVDRLMCHYCGDRRIPPLKCPDCGCQEMAHRGIGTKTVYDQVTAMFPDYKMMRWDRDSVRDAREHHNIIERFRTREIQVLIGTQMIVKGLHFPSVTLAAAVLADVGMGIPDYRAGERTFQHLYQLAGRAGRGSSPGRVIIQTYQPDNYAIRAAAIQNYASFYRSEIKFREEHGNPPFGRLIRLIHSDVNSERCQLEATRTAAILREEKKSWGFSEIEIAGPTPCYPTRMRGRFRWQILLRGPNPRILLSKINISNNWTIDVDPFGTV